MPTIESLLRIKSTSAHRNYQRSCGISELINLALIAPWTTAGLSPIKLSQVILSTQAFFKPGLKPLERTAHGIQSGVALSEALVMSILFFNKQECIGQVCPATEAMLCRWIIFLGFVYNATLFAGWIPAEFLKEAYDEDSSINSSIRENNSASQLLLRNENRPLRHLPSERSDLNSSAGGLTPISPLSLERGMVPT